jgi:hypothetical protein
MRLATWIVSAWLCVALGPVRAQAGDAFAGLALTGETGATTTLSLTELAALPQTEVRARDPNGTEVVFRGPALRELATKAGAPTATCCATRR